MSMNCLSQFEIEQFYKLWNGLIYYVNETYEIVPHFDRLVYGQHMNYDVRLLAEITDHLWKNPQWVDDYLLATEAEGLSRSERDTLKAWREHHVTGQFVVVQHLAKYSVFMHTQEDQSLKLYGVWGISDPIKLTYVAPLPTLVFTTLLPFAGKIIYDSILQSYPVYFGGGAKRSFMEDYNNAKATNGIVVGIANDTEIFDATLTRATPVPKATLARYEEISQILDQFCGEFLDPEARELFDRALKKICRKRPSPIVFGDSEHWACGIVYALCSYYGLFYESKEDRVSASSILDYFDESKSSAARITKIVKEILGMPSTRVLC